MPMIVGFGEALSVRARARDLETMRTLLVPSEGLRLLDLGGSIRFQEGHAESIPFPDDSFDRVTAVVSFHHMADQKQALAEIRRVLKGSGRLVLFELPPSRAPGPLMQWIAGYRHGGYMAFHGPDDLLEQVRAAGFRDAATRRGVSGYFVVGTK